VCAICERRACGALGYDAAAFLADMRALNVTPHIAQSISGRRSAVNGRTTRHAGYAVSQRKRKRIEEPFGWGKTIGGLARPMLRGVEKLGRLQSDPAYQNSSQPEHERQPHIGNSRTPSITFN
jgi:hypothetical protein